MKVNNNEEDGKRYFVAFHNLQSTVSLRQLTTDRIGTLIEISGTVTRSSAVRPELVQGSFTCLDCRQEIPNIQQQFVYSEPTMCLNPVCENRERWSLQLARSVFVDWQVLRVQENPSEIPAGSMPRNMRIIVRNETVEAAKPGDKCTFTGSLIVVPDVAQFGLARAGGVSMRKKTVARDGITGVSGLKQLGARDLTYTMCFLACDVKSHASRSNLAEQEEENFDNFSAFERETIMRIRRTPKLYQKMIKSVAPTIFGHDEIKRGILLQLFGGVMKHTKDQARLRGDINVCIVGDPSTSKSQFLKYNRVVVIPG